MDSASEPVATGEWECMECGYVEEGVKTQRLLACPDCSAPAQALEFFPYEDDEDDSDWEEEGFEDEVMRGRERSA